MTKVTGGMKAYCLLEALTIEREIASEFKATFKFRTPNFAILRSRLTQLCNILGDKFCPSPAQKEKQKVNHIRIANLTEINDRSDDVLCISIWRDHHYKRLFWVIKFLLRKLNLSNTIH